MYHDILLKSSQLLGKCGAVVLGMATLASWAEAAEAHHSEVTTASAVHQLHQAGLAVTTQGTHGLGVGPANVAGEGKPEFSGIGEQTTLFGGMFAHLGQPRLPLFTTHGDWAGPAIAAEGVWTALLRKEYIYLGGNFARIAGQERQGLARLLRSGVVDASWQPKVTGTVHTMLFRGDRLYLGGAFTAVDGLPRRNLAAIDLTSGAVVPWQADTDATVWALAADGENLYVGGAFLSIGDEPRERLARITLLDAKVDDTFTVACDADVRALVLQDSDLYLGGFFQRIGPSHRGGVAKINTAKGTLVTDWVANADGPVLALSGETGHLYVGGTFSTLGGQLRSNLGRVDESTGMVDLWKADTNEGVTALGESPGGELLVAGRFTSLGGLPSNGLARVTPEGKPDPTWHPPVGKGATGIYDDGATILVTGATALDGPKRACVAAFDAHGATTAWQAEVAGNAPHITAIAFTSEAVFLGGDFNAVNGITRQNLVRIDRVTGRVDGRWQVNANSLVRALSVKGDSLYIAGNFTRLGATSQSYAGRLALKNGAVETWNPNLDGPVFAIIPTAGSDSVWLAGAFSLAGGAPHRGLALVNGTDATAVAGTPDLLDAQGRGGSGYALLPLGDGRLLVGGEFTTVGAVPRNNLAMLTSDLQVETQWQADTNGAVMTLATDDRNVAIGGGFSQIADQEQIGLAVLSLQPGAKPIGGFSSMDGEVQALSLARNSLWVGGGFAGHARRLDWTSGATLPCPPTDGVVRVISSTSGR